MSKTFEYDVGLSFAGEQRAYVEQVAYHLKSRGIRTFYDDYEKGSLWGKDLYAYLSEVYQHLCRYCVVFVSKEYGEKVWPTQERQAAQSRALEEKGGEYVLPARFDNTDLPGLLGTLGYIDLNQMSPEELAGLIEEKLGQGIRENYLPPSLDLLFERLGIPDTDLSAQEDARWHAQAFFDTLRRMTVDERRAVISLFSFGCPADLPYNIHIDTDLLSRHTGEPEAKLVRLLGGIRSLGFHCTREESREHEDASVPSAILGDQHFFYLEWHNLKVRREDDEEIELPELLVANEMIAGATEGYCEEHGIMFLERLDFSQLASATVTSESAGHRGEG